jgi:WD40 repeat protein
MRQAGYEEIQRMIREEEPPRPSTRLSTLGAALPTVARKRGTEPVKLTRQLRGELDWIVMKALEKERSRRYETASAFADDIRRHLNDEPVSASPPSRLYRLRKLARRNKQAILLAVAVGTALAVGTVVSLWQASLARQARDAAVMAKNHASEENSSRKRQLAEAARTDRLTAMELFGQNRHRDAFAFLARACDYDPESTLAAETAILQLNTLSLARELLVLKGEGEFPTEPLNRNGWLQRLEQHQWLGADDAAFTSDGRHIFSVQTMPQAFGEGTAPSPFAHLWDANTGRLQESLALKAADRTDFNEKPASVAMSIGTLAFDWPWESNAVRDTAMPSPDGSRSVITQNGTAVLRDVAGKEGRSLDGHEGEVLCARFSSDGLALVTGGTDQNALLHDVETEEVRAWIIGHAGPVTQARFSRDGAKMVTCSEDTTARIWETAATRLMVQAGDIGEDSLMDVGFSASGRDIIARTFGQKFWTWNLETGEASGPPVYFENHEIVGEVNFNHPMALVCRPQDTKTDAEASTAEVMNLATQQSQAKLQGHAGPVQRAVFSANGQWVATQAQDRIVRVWEIRTGRQVFQTPNECSELGCLLFSPDSTRLLVPDKNHLRLLEVPSGRVMFESSLDENEEVVSAAFSPDGTLLATGSNDSVARVWEHASGRLAATLKDHPQTVSSVTFSPDGTMLATACWRESVVQIWNTATWQRLSLIKKSGESMERAIFSPDGRFVTAASDRAAALNLWEARTGELVTSLRWPEMDLRSIAFSQDGRRVITASRRGGPLIWELPGFQGPVPAWFADFLRYLVRREVAQKNGRPRNLGPDTAESLRKSIEDACREDNSRFGEIARWFLTPAEQRPVRPGGKDTRHAVADRLITAEAGPVQLRQALQYDPASPLAHYALARHAEDQTVAEFLRGWALENLPSPIPDDLQTRLDSLHVTEVEHSLDVPAFTHSPDGKMGVTVPTLDQFNESQHQNKLVEVATRRALAVIQARPGMQKMNHGGAYAKWTKDGSGLLWAVAGKWCHRSLAYLQIADGRVVWQTDLLRTSQQEILKRVKAAAPEPYTAAVQENRGNGTAYPDGFTIDVESEKGSEERLPLRFLVCLTSGPKGFSGMPVEAAIVASMRGVLAENGSITWANFKVLTREQAIRQEDAFGSRVEIKDGL